MEKDKIFFGESGLTSTSANHIANLAKESYRTVESKLDSLKLYTTTVKLISSSEEHVIREGVSSLQDLDGDLLFVSQLKSLIAWLREAIKAKDRLIEEAKSTSYSDYGIEVPERPIREENVTPDDVISNWNIKKRNRYYYLETLCSTFGKYIHPDGTLSKERNELLNAIHAPHRVEGSGRDAIIYTKSPSLSEGEVEDVFMQLQNEYRSYQSELNSLKNEIDTEVNELNTEKSVKYSSDMEKYRNEMSLIDAKFSVEKQNAINKAMKLKIIIPDSLRSVYEKVNSLGK